MPPVSDVLERLGRPPAVAALDGEDAVYVVGGAVRDLLLGRRPQELDFVVEGDAVAVARRAAERLGGRVTAHERFGTATVAAPEATFDVTAARRERYPRPGALPDVELGASLREDLDRRDFTVNAIALHLADGRLLALPGAEDDLAARRLRVLHDGSFRDDPTRMLRLARYAARLGFEPDPGTDALVDPELLSTVTGSRLGAELRLLLREPQPAALLALERHGLGRALLGPSFAVDPALINRAQALTPPDARPDLVALAATLDGPTFAGPSHDPADPSGGTALRARLDELAFPAGERDIVANAVRRAPGLVDSIDADRHLAEALEPIGDDDLWRMLRKRDPETVALAGAMGSEASARRWLDEVRHRRLAITGDDIVAAGLYGPRVGEALDAAMEAMLRGEAPDREAQLAAALGRRA
jgi:tRNA nucleotidyltransferase (CCA-adding enzyme)